MTSRVALVTGGTGGIGTAICKRLAQAGHRVATNYRNEGKARAWAEAMREEGFGFTLVRGDVSSPDEAATMVRQVEEALGPIDILVNNAGILRDRSFGKMSLEEFRQVLDVHLVGAAICCKAVWDTMRAQRYGRIVMTTSSSGLWGNFGQANYGAAKMALVGLMQTLAIEGAKYGITVNSLAPTAYTRMMEGILPQEQLDALDPRLVSPALLPLVVEDAPTRAIVCAGAGHFARAHVALTQGRYIGGGDDAGERLIAAWDAVSSTQGQVIPGYGFTQAEREIASARAHAGADAPA